MKFAKRQKDFSKVMIIIGAIIQKANEETYYAWLYLFLITSFCKARRKYEVITLISFANVTNNSAPKLKAVLMMSLLR